MSTTEESAAVNLIFWLGLEKGRHAEVGDSVLDGEGSFYFFIYEVRSLEWCRQRSLSVQVHHLVQWDLQNGR